MSSIGDNIKRIRLEKGMTQQELADACTALMPKGKKMFGSAIRKYESGKVNPKYDVLGRIAEALGASMSELTNLQIYYNEKGELSGAVGYEQDLKSFINEEKPAPHVFEVNKSALIGAIQTTKLIDEFQKLNGFGKDNAITYIEELAKNPKYMK